MLLAGTTAEAHSQIGIMGGYNRDSFGTFANQTFRLADKVDGFNTGIFLDFELGRFGVRPAIIYRQLQNAVIDIEEELESDLEVVEVPVDLRVTAPLPVVTPYIFGGPSLLFPSSSDAAVDVSLAGARLALAIGVGAEIDLGFRLWPEIRFATSLGGLIENDQVDASRLETFVARVGVSF